MKTLNRPMFRMGGPIKEGIMDGIEEPRRAYQDGAFGTSAYTQKDYDDFIKRMFVTPPPSETTIPGILRPDVKNFFQDGMVTDQYSYDNLFKPTKTVIRDGKEVQVPASIFDTAMIDTIGGKTNLFDYAKAGMEGRLANRMLTGGKTGFATALKEDILSKLPKMEVPKGGGAAFSEEEITESDIEDNPTYITKMQEGVLRRGSPGGDADIIIPPKKPKTSDDGAAKPEADSELLQKLGYDRAVKRGNYQLIEAIRQGLTEGGVQGALDAAFAAGAQNPYSEANKIKQAAALKDYESGLEEKKYQRRRGDLLEDKKELTEFTAKINKKYKTASGQSIEEKRYNFGQQIGLTGNDLDIFTRGAKTIDENILTALSKSTYGTLNNQSLFTAVAAAIGADKVINIDKDDRYGTKADIPDDFGVGNYVVEGTKLFVVKEDADGNKGLQFQANYGQQEVKCRYSVNYPLLKKKKT